MNCNAFDLGLVIERLKTLECLSAVGSLIEYTKVTDLTAFITPSAYVIPASEVGQPNQGTGRQRADIMFGVVIAIQNYEYNAVSPLLHQSSPIIGQVRSCLMGWLPPVKGGRTVQWVRGDALDYNASTLVWLEQFQTAQFIGNGQ